METSPTPSAIPAAAIAPARLWLRASWLTNQVAHHAHRIVMEHVAETGMRKQHFSVLAAIDELGAPTQAALAAPARSTVRTPRMSPSRPSTGTAMAAASM